METRKQTLMRQMPGKTGAGPLSTPWTPWTSPKWGKGGSRSTLTPADSAAFATPALTTGTPFVSSFCTPNTTHRRSRPPPLVPKMPLGPGQICSLCVRGDRTSVKRARVLAAVAVGDVGSLLSRSTSIYTRLGLSEMLKSRQRMNQPLCLLPVI